MPGHQSARWGTLRRAVLWTGLALFVPVAIAIAAIDADRRTAGTAFAIAGAVCGLAVYWSFRLHAVVGQMVAGLALAIGTITLLNTPDGAARSALVFAAGGSLTVSSALFHRARSREPKPLPSHLGAPIASLAERVGVPLERPRFTVRVPSGWTGWSVKNNGRDEQVELFEGSPGEMSPRIGLVAASAEGKTLTEVIDELKRVEAGMAGKDMKVTFDESPVSIAGARGYRIAMRLSGGKLAWLLRLAAVIGYVPVGEAIMVESGGWIYGGTLMGLSRDARRVRRVFDEVMSSLRWA